MAKCKVVHIGVFFDGTGNNKHNDTPKGSESNIAKLSELYIHGKVTNWSNEQCDHYGDKIYKEGVGTYNDGGKFVDRKYEKGAGGGGAKRINETIDKLVSLLNNDYPVASEKNGEGYRERIIDVFGFSRGAAMARDFINTFYDRNERLFKLTKVRINFVGLYDTVGSFGIAGDNINYKPIDANADDEASTHYVEHAKKCIYTADGLSNNSVESVKTVRIENKEALVKSMIKNGWEVKESKQWLSDKTFYTVTFIKAAQGFEPYNFVLAHNSAKKIVHMIASDEVRKNFPLSSINSIVSKDPLTGHQEWTYGGVHSDIGGGYKPKMIEKHRFAIGRFVSYYDSELAIEQAKKSLSSGWQFYRIPEPRVNLLGKVMNRVHHTHAFNNREVTNEITYITLHRMYEEAIQHKVPFKPISTPMPASMKEYNIHTKANPSKAMSFKGMQKLRVKYFHHSAVDQDERDTHYDGNTSIPAVLLDDSPDGIGGNDTRYARTKSGKIIVEREIYPNKGRAIPPTKF